MTELLLGCGASRIKRLGGSDWTGLVTMDINPSHHPDIVGDLADLSLIFPDNYATEIHAYHVLEHTGRQGDWEFFFAQWSEFWRILVPGGIFYGIVPWWQSEWAWADPGHTRVIAPGTLIFLDQTEYVRQVGRTAMADYRSHWRGDFEYVLNQTDGQEFQFALRAHKPVRTST